MADSVETVPDVLAFFTCPEEFLIYDRIVGVMLDGVTYPIEETPATSQRPIPLTGTMRQGLAQVARDFCDGHEYNCHGFSRVLHGTSLDIGRADLPITKTIEGRPIVTRLALGSVGIIGFDTEYMPHSVVGLGEDESDCIQVMSTGGSIGVTDLDELVGFYAATHPNWRVNLFLAEEPLNG